VGSGGGAIRPVPSARSVLVAVGLPGNELSTTNWQLGPYPPVSVPSVPRTDQEYVAPSVKAAAGMVVLNGPGGAAYPESAGAYCAGIPVTCHCAATLSPLSESDRLAISRTPLLALTCGAVGPHAASGSMVMSVRLGAPGAWLKFTLSTAVSGKNFFHRLCVDSPPPDEFIAESAMV
jgi:hypothetical protein